MLKNLVLFILICLVACGLQISKKSTTSIDSDFKKEFGHYLFFDKALSFNMTKSCSSCHDPKLAFTDGYRKSLGATADLHQRNSSSLLNISRFSYFTAADTTLTTLEKQLQNPFFNNKFIELGVSGHEVEILNRIKSNPSYQKIFKHFKQPINEISMQLIIASLADYCKSLNSYQSKYDLYLKNPKSNIFTKSEKAGMDLFFSDSFACSQCHGGINFNTPKLNPENIFLKNGFFLAYKTNVATKFSEDFGLYNVSHNPQDIGRFRIPSLRNVLLTSPYMHDGNIETITELLQKYSQGGIINAPKDDRIKGFNMTKQEESSIISFLTTLTDTSYYSNPLFLNLVY